MGNWNECAEAGTYEYEIDTQDSVELDKLELLGVGSFARVWKVKLKSFENDNVAHLKQDYFSKPLALKEFK